MNYTAPGRDRLGKMFGVRGIPTLILFDSEGNVITMEGREMVTKDPTGERFPWTGK